jgi:hypothetical protein
VGEHRIDGRQLRLDLAGPSTRQGNKLWENAMLVTDVASRWSPSLRSIAIVPMRRTPSTA